MGLHPAINSLRVPSPDEAEALCALSRDTFREKFGHLYPTDDLNTFFTKAYDVENERVCMNDPRNYYIVASEGARLVAYARSGPCGLPIDTGDERAFELVRLYVRGHAQGKGLGAEMLKRVIAHAKSKNYDTLYIGVWEKNFDAQRFYARHGFVEVGEYKFIVGKTIDRELILRKALT